MAELGIIASVVQIADTGLRLSIKLCTFGEIVASADKSVLTISKDVSLASSVLKELGAILAKDKETKILTETAIKTADDVVKECLQIFEEMEDIIIKRLPNLREPGVEKASRVTLLLERLRWPYLQPKLQLLQSNLDRLKSTILLMLNVISYARQTSMKSDPDHLIAHQRSLIEDLAQSNQDYIRTFETLKLEAQAQPVQSDTSDQNCHEKSLVVVQPNPASSTQETRDVTPPGTVLDNESLFEDYTMFAGDERFTELQHYLSMLTAILKETDLIKYRIDYDRRARVRQAVHDTFDRDVHSLASPFGDNCLSLVKNHFASVMAASSDKVRTELRGEERSFTKSGSTFQPALPIADGLPASYPTSVSHNPYTYGPIYSAQSTALPARSTSSYDYPLSVNEGSPSALRGTFPEDSSARGPDPLKPQCWYHGCNGRQFRTFSDLYRHQREKLGNNTKSVCHRCGAEFSRKTARDGHLAHYQCQRKSEEAGGQDIVTGERPYHSGGADYVNSSLSITCGSFEPAWAMAIPATVEYASAKRQKVGGNTVDELVALWTLPSVAGSSSDNAADSASCGT